MLTNSKRGEEDVGNELHNSNWLENEYNSPKYYVSLGKIHFDSCRINESRVASLQIGTKEKERLNYLEPITVQGKEYLTMGLMIRGNDIEAFYYQVIFLDSEKQKIKKINQNIASEITTQFKKITVTCKIPVNAHYASISWEIIGCATGVTLYHPSVTLK